MFGRVAKGEGKGRVRTGPCLVLAPIFMLRPTWLEVFLGPPAPTSPKSGFQLLHSPLISHLLCSIQAGTCISRGWELCFCFGVVPVIRVRFHQGAGSVTFPKPFKGWVCPKAWSFHWDCLFLFLYLFIVQYLSLACTAEVVSKGAESEAVYRTSANH